MSNRSLKSTLATIIAVLLSISYAVQAANGAAAFPDSIANDYSVTNTPLIELAVAKATAAPVNTKIERTGTMKTYLAGEAQEIDAISEGCKVKESVFSNYERVFSVIECDSGVAGALGLWADAKIELTDSGANKIVGADRVHSAGNTGQGMVVAVLDTGVDYTHPELSGSYAGGRDFANNDDDPMDDNGHGTFISGLITANGLLPSYTQFLNKYGEARGIAPGAKIYALKVMSANGEGAYHNVVAAIYWAINGPDGVYGTDDDPNVAVITGSLGMPSAATREYCNSDSVTKNAIIYANSKGVPVVFAAGNSGISGVYSPGCISDSITVGATDKITDSITSFSSRGYAVDITAPGTGIYGLAMGGGYVSGVSGTSSSAPMVAGTIALIRKAHPEYSVEQIKDALRNSAVYKGSEVPVKVALPAISKYYSSDYGWGRLNAYNAVFNPMLGAYHSECSNNACVLVSGAGKNQCDSSLECFCTDSDGGFVKGVYGVTKGMYDGDWGTEFDECEGSMAVIEHYCDGRNVRSATVSCESKERCFNGACLRPEQWMPDLVTFVAAPQTAVVGQSFLIEFYTSNNGYSDSNESILRYYFDGKQVGDLEIPPISRSRRDVASVTCLQGGRYEISAMIDATDTTYESNELNNWGRAQVECLVPFPPKSEKLKYNEDNFHSETLTSDTKTPEIGKVSSDSADG